MPKKKGQHNANLDELRSLETDIPMVKKAVLKAQVETKIQLPKMNQPPAGGGVTKTAVNWFDINNPPAIPPFILVGTRANILATSAATVRLAIANDAAPGEPNVYLADGTAWRQTPIRWATGASAGPDIGAITYNPDAGYGEGDLSNKVLHTVQLGYYNESLMPAVAGALRVSGGLIQGYQSGAWKNFRLLSADEINDIMLYSQLAYKKALAVNSDLHTVMDAQGFVDIGAYASDHIIDCGVLV